MNCPKCKHLSLLDSSLAGNLPVKQCPDCTGIWIQSAEYEAWQKQQPQKQVEPELFAQLLNNEDSIQSPLDIKAGLCPECNRILSRAKVSVKTPFYVERCPSCSGIWCDEGEWNVLEKLGMHATIEQLFTSGWQARMREQQQAEQERQAVVDKVGSEIAVQVFELASVLEKHPNGDFAAAYMMRRFEKDRLSNFSEQNP
ncbi:MAG: zf-TFIIB domain-containing protein [Aphanothece sp. CMT-3BRIN-NPC111]|nr:zf-TFIIB domain-containing protein [Aphanothece sp. CMT-3BRIN-NPC111]